MFKKAWWIALFLTVLAAASCGDYQKLLKSSDNELKYEKAVAYYQKGDYYRAEQLFDQLIPVYRGTDKAEMLYYYSAQAYYEQKQYFLASHYFKRFTKNFPKSQYAEECSFMAAYCKFLDSPRASLDQTNTYDAINELQLFANMYPQSSRIEECNTLIDELRAKLEEKAISNANLYFRMEDYKAAITSYRNVLKEFPATKHREEIMRDIFRSAYHYASKSVPSKQNERFAEALDAYNAFIAEFPSSEYLRSVTGLKENILKANPNLRT
jgi:outer membrane protein assembly factor BamD